LDILISVYYHEAAKEAEELKAAEEAYQAELAAAALAKEIAEAEG